MRKWRRHREMGVAFAIEEGVPRGGAQLCRQKRSPLGVPKALPPAELNRTGDQLDQSALGLRPPVLGTVHLNSVPEKGAEDLAPVEFDRGHAPQPALVGELCEAVQPAFQVRPDGPNLLHDHPV